MALNIGEVIHHDRYRIEEKLGQGGMGAVYKAWDLNLGIPVAIKENLEITPEAQKQFVREANMLAKLVHPNLPRVIDYFSIPDQGQYLVMDYIDGEDLRSMFTRLGRLPEPQVLSWIGQITEALAYLHSQPTPIIHRDIKPANIKVRPDGRAVLVDFGIAKFYDPKLATTMGAKAITPGYSPPEQYGGGSTDTRSDIYALGATLFTLLTGQEPPESVLRAVKQVDFPRPRELNSDISPQVEEAILKSVEISTARRYQTISELRQVLNGKPDVSPVLVSTPSMQREAVQASKTDSGGTRVIPRDMLLPKAEKSAETPGVPAGRKFPVWIWIAAAAALVLLIALFAGLALKSVLGNRSTPTSAALLVLPSATTMPVAEATETSAPATPISTPETATSTASLPVSPTSYNVIAELTAPEGMRVRAVEQKDNIAYVLTHQNWLYWYDLSNMAGDQEFTSYTEFAGQIRLDNSTGLLRNGDILYAYGNAGLQVIDIQNALQPTIKKSVKELMIYSLTLSGNYLIAPGDQMIAIYDVSNPSNPQSFTKVVTAKGVMNFAAVVYEDYLYVSEFISKENSSKGLLKVYSFSDPKHPREIQRIDPGEVAYHLRIVDDQLIRCTTNDIELWELSRRDNPRFLMAEPGQARVCEVQQNNVVGNGSIVKVSTATLELLSTFDPQTGLSGSQPLLETYPYGSVVSGNYVFLAQPGRVLVLSAGTP
jgi:serine/threonine protein kinase